MSELDRRPSRLPRRAREDRAYRLVLAGSALGLVAVVGIVLAFLDVIGFGLPLLAGLLAVAAVFLFQRTVRG